MSDLVPGLLQQSAPGQRRATFQRFFRGRITATSSGATQTLYTADSTVDPQTGVAKTMTQLNSLWIGNLDVSVAHNFAVYIVESGGSVDDDRVLIPYTSIAAGTMYHVNQIQELIDNGGTIQAYADVANKIVMRLSGTVIR